MRHQKGLSSKDKTARSQLRLLLGKADGMIHGSMIQMARCCGNPNCKCALKGEKHVSWYLGVTEKRKTRMKHIPKAMEATVRRWVQQYQQAQSLMNQCSQEAWAKLNSDTE